MTLFTSCREEVFSDTELPGIVVSKSSVLMAKEKEPQRRWVLLVFPPPLGFLGFAGSA